jgi:hypothetical protein
MFYYWLRYDMVSLISFRSQTLEEVLVGIVHILPKASILTIEGSRKKVNKDLLGLPPPPLDDLQMLQDG